MPEFFSIWILPYDPFCGNRMLYTVKNLVAENNQIVYNDGVTKIFLYTGGTIGGTRALKALLDFMERSVRDNATDDELTEIMNIVDTIKCDSEERRRYMGIMNVIDYEKRDAYEEGIERGGIQGIIQACKSLGVNQERAAQELIKHFSLIPDKAQEYVSLYWDTPLNTQP